MICAFSCCSFVFLLLDSLSCNLFLCLYCRANYVLQYKRDIQGLTVTGLVIVNKR